MLKINGMIKEEIVSISRYEVVRNHEGGFTCWGGEVGGGEGISSWGHSWHREQHYQRHAGGTLHSTVGKLEVDSGLVCGRMAGDKANSDWCSLTFLCLRLVPNVRTNLYLPPTLIMAPWQPRNLLGNPYGYVYLDLCPAHICSHSVSIHHLRLSSHCNCIHSASGHFNTPPYPASVYSCVKELNGSSTDFTNS